VGALGLLLRQRRAFDPAVFRWLVWSIVVTVGSELSFTAYSDVYGLYNVIGHLLKVVAIYLVYKAVIETGLRRPYHLLFRDLKQREETLHETQDKLQAILDNTQQSFLLLDRQGRIQAFNRMAAADADKVLGQNIREGESFYQFMKNSETLAANFARALAGETVTVERDFQIGAQRAWFIFTYNPVVTDTGQVVGVCFNAMNITTRKQVETEREQLITELKEVLAQVKQLSGLLPICASCKKIRDDQGYWHQVESYLQDHAGVDFSHGICPDCRATLYPKEKYPFLYEKE
jgi:PAS domain S-box-containing protein